MTYNFVLSSVLLSVCLLVVISAYINCIKPMCWCSITKENGLLPTVELIFQHPHIPHPAERDDGFLVLERKLNNDSLYWQTRANWYHMSEESRFTASFYQESFSIFLSYTQTALWETLITFGLIVLLHQTSSYCLIWTKNLHRIHLKHPPNPSSPFLDSLGLHRFWRWGFSEGAGGGI